MNGYKTIIAGLVCFISGISLMLGVELPPELLDALKENVEAAIGSVTVLCGTVFTILRHFTNGEAPWKKWFKKSA